MAMRQVQVLIKSGGTSSRWVTSEELADSGSLAIVGVATPGTVDAVALQIDYSIDGGTTALINVGSDGTAKTITQTSNDFIVLAPSEYPIVPGAFRLTAASAVAANRTYTVFLRDV